MTAAAGGTAGALTGPLAGLLATGLLASARLLPRPLARLDAGLPRLHRAARLAEVDNDQGIGCLAAHRAASRLCSTSGLCSTSTARSAASGLCPASTACTTRSACTALHEEHVHALLLGNLLQAYGLTIPHRGNTQVVLRRRHHEAGNAVKAVGGREHYRACSLASGAHPAGAILLTRPASGSILFRLSPAGTTGARLISAAAHSTAGAIGTAGKKENLEVARAAHRAAGYLRLTLAGARHPTARSARRGAALLCREQHNDVRDLSLLQLNRRTGLEGLLDSLRILTGLAGAVRLLSRLLCGFLPRLLARLLAGLARPVLLSSARSAGALVALRQRD